MSDKQALLKSLDEIAAECAVSPATIAHVKEFIRLLPDDVALPELAPEPDGSIGMDWIHLRNCQFSVSVDDSNSIPFAYVDEPNRECGVVCFSYHDVIPDGILDYIKLVSTKGDPK